GALAFACQLLVHSGLAGESECPTYLPFRLRLMRLTMSLAVRSISFGVPLLAGSYTDQTTTRDLASTRKTVPLDRPNDELLAGFDSLFTVSPSNGATSPPVFSGFGGGSSFSLSGVGKISSSFIWKPSPIWSVKIASANLGSV